MLKVLNKYISKEDFNMETFMATRIEEAREISLEKDRLSTEHIS